MAFLYAASTLLAERAEASFWTERRRAAEKRAELASASTAGPKASLQPLILPPLAGAHDVRAFWEKRLGLSRENAWVVDQWSPPAGAPYLPLVIHLQDAHGIYSAQKNSAAVLRSLSRMKAPLWVFAEGAWGPVDLGWLARFPDRRAKEITAEFALRQGDIPAEEYLAILSTDSLRIQGVEKRDSYAANLAARQWVDKDRQAILARLSDMQRRLIPLKEKIYGAKLKTLDKARTAFQARKLELGPYAEKLSQSAPQQAADFPQVRAFLDSLRLEKRLSFAAVENERRVLLAAAAKAPDSQQLQRLTTAAADFRAGQLKGSEFYEYLVRASGVAPKNHAAMSAYIDYLKKSELIEATKLNTEFQEFEKQAFNRLTYGNPSAARVEILQRQLDEQRKFWSEQFTPRDWLGYQSKESAWSRWPSLERAFAQEEARLKGAPVTMSRSKNLPRLPHLPLTQQAFFQESFFKLAEKRNAAMVENTLKKALEEKQAQVVLVAGGFHTPGITSLLRAKGVPYVVVMPQIAASDLKGPSSQNAAETWNLRSLAKRAETGATLAAVSLILNPQADASQFEGLRASGGGFALATPFENATGEKLVLGTRPKAGNQVAMVLWKFSPQGELLARTQEAGEIISYLTGREFKVQPAWRPTDRLTEQAGPVLRGAPLRASVEGQRLTFLLVQEENTSVDGWLPALARWTQKYPAATTAVVSAAVLAFHVAYNVLQGAPLDVLAIARSSFAGPLAAAAGLQMTRGTNNQDDFDPAASVAKGYESVADTLDSAIIVILKRSGGSTFQFWLRHPEKVEDLFNKGALNQEQYDKVKAAIQPKGFEARVVPSFYEAAQHSTSRRQNAWRRSRSYRLAVLALGAAGFMEALAQQGLIPSFMGLPQLAVGFAAVMGSLDVIYEPPPAPPELHALEVLDRLSGRKPHAPLEETALSQTELARMKTMEDLIHQENQGGRALVRLWQERRALREQLRKTYGPMGPPAMEQLVLGIQFIQSYVDLGAAERREVKELLSVMDRDVAPKEFHMFREMVLDSIDGQTPAIQLAASLAEADREERKIFNRAQKVASGLPGLTRYLEATYGAMDDLSFDQMSRLSPDYFSQLPISVQNAYFCTAIGRLNDEHMVTVDDKQINHSGFTINHSARVTGYALLMFRRAKARGAAELQIPEAAFVASMYLHDIGKIFVPREILFKPSFHTPEERAVMQQHAQDGALFLEFIGAPPFMQAAALTHHERPDGFGYPNKLSEAEMAPLAFIAAVADAFDAMTADRPYRRGMPLEKALLQVWFGVGGQFQSQAAQDFFAYYPSPVLSPDSSSGDIDLWRQYAGADPRQDNKIPLHALAKKEAGFLYGEFKPGFDRLRTLLDRLNPDTATPEEINTAIRELDAFAGSAGDILKSREPLAEFSWDKSANHTAGIHLVHMTAMHWLGNHMTSIRGQLQMAWRKEKRNPVSIESAKNRAEKMSQFLEDLHSLASARAPINANGQEGIDLQLLRHDMGPASAPQARTTSGRAAPLLATAGGAPLTAGQESALQIMGQIGTGPVLDQVMQAPPFALRREWEKILHLLGEPSHRQRIVQAPWTTPLSKILSNHLMGGTNVQTTFELHANRGESHAEMVLISLGLALLAFLGLNTPGIQVAWQEWGLAVQNAATQGLPALVGLTGSLHSLTPQTAHGTPFPWIFSSQIQGNTAGQEDTLTEIADPRAAANHVAREVGEAPPILNASESNQMNLAGALAFIGSKWGGYLSVAQSGASGWLSKEKNDHWVVLDLEGILRVSGQTIETDRALPWRLALSQTMARLAPALERPGASLRVVARWNAPGLSDAQTREALREIVRELGLPETAQVFQAREPGEALEAIRSRRSGETAVHLFTEKAGAWKDFLASSLATLYTILDVTADVELRGDEAKMFYQWLQANGQSSGVEWDPGTGVLKLRGRKDITRQDMENFWHTEVLVNIQA